MLKSFKKFLLRGNLVDLAIGFTVGAAFTTVAKSLVNDIIMPPISLLLGQSNFSNIFAVLKDGSPAGPYTSLEEATSAGAVTLNYGAFLNSVFALLLVAVAMFVMVGIVRRLEEEIETKTQKKKDKKDEPSNKKCQYCFTTIDYRASRCPSCTSKLPENKS